MKINIEVNKPFKFKLFATTINVVWDNVKMNDEQKYGESSYSSCKITLSNTHGVNELSQDRIKDTFYHERVHMILNTMHRDDLSSNEEFVDVFAKLWRQSDETMEL
jgi:hypothetical protein